MLLANHHIGFGAFDDESCECTPSLVTGDRTSRITVTKSGFSWDAGSDSNLVDGATLLNSTDSVDTPSSFPDASFIRFQFSSPTKVSAMRTVSQGAFTFGDWTIYAGNGAQTINHGTFTISGTNTHDAAFTGAVGGYTDIYMVKSGTQTPTNTWWQQVQFTECTCP